MAHKNRGLVCPKGFSGRTQKRGKQSLYCRDCDKFSSIENSLLVSFPQMTVQQKKYFKEPEAPKVLVFDIETLPIIGTFWGTGKEYISYKNILEDFVVLSWSAKWLYDDKVMGDILTPEEAQKRLVQVFLPEKEKKKNPHNADFRILQRIWKLLDEAEVVITQNGITNLILES